MEKKQTAVEWLWHHFNVSITKPDDSMLDKAKEMEKQQIADAQSYAISNADMTNNRGYFDCDKYYNETYGK